MEKIKKLWQNEYFKTAFSILALIIIFLIFWYGSTAYFNTETPYLVVSSGSMRPTLEVGDLIIVKKVHPSKLNDGLFDGDIIVYETDKGELRVHRLIKIVPTNSGYLLTTQGDANDSPLPDEINFSDQRYLGRVIARVPFIGHISLFMHTQQGFYISLFVIIFLIILFMFFPSDENGKNEEASMEKEGKNRLYRFISSNYIPFLILSILVVGFLIFSLWGSFSFWQPGAERGFQWVTIRGMYPDLQYHENSVKVESAILHQGLFTYKIDCMMANGVRTGVPTFSWWQFSILILIVINVWMITKFQLFGTKVKI